MFIHQYAQMLRELGVGRGYEGFNHHSHGFPADQFKKDVAGCGVKILVMEGKHVGEVATVNEIVGTKLKATTEGGKPVTPFYYQVDRLGRDGKPMIEPIVDMVGRAISPGEWLAYMAQNPHNNKSGLGIAKVLDSNRKGELTVKIEMYDGERTPEGFGDGVRSLSNPRKSLRLPIDGQELLMLFMNDFNRFS